MYIEDGIKALLEPDERLYPTPAQASNLLHVSTQVPARIAYYTSGPTRRLEYDYVTKKTSWQEGGTVIKCHADLIHSEIDFPEEAEYIPICIVQAIVNAEVLKYTADTWVLYYLQKTFHHDPTMLEKLQKLKDGITSKSMPISWIKDSIDAICSREIVVVLDRDKQEYSNYN